MDKTRVILQPHEHTFVYDVGPNREADFVKRVYIDSRNPTIGFSLRYVLKAIRMLRGNGQAANT